MNQLKGCIFGIQHFSIHDGPGIRSNVFLKGCPLRCRWCHNPEGLFSGIGLQYFQKDCVRCGRCNEIYTDIAASSRLPEIEKRALAENCPSGALRLVGEWMSVEEVLKNVRKDKNYFDASGGGMTISGGEPMLQAEFACSLAEAAAGEEIRTALETSGFAPREHYIRILPYIDVFLWDYKAESGIHRELTGVDAALIRGNLESLYENGAKIILRCPLIPGVNDTENHLKGIADMSRLHPDFAGVEIMPYHNLGVSKAIRVGGSQDSYTVPDKVLKKRWEQAILSYGGIISRMN